MKQISLTKQISKEELQEILNKHQMWLKRVDGGDKANLSRVNLSGENLSGKNLWGADLSRADLSQANLSGTTLGEANLSGADLSGANLSEVYLWRANLSEAIFNKTNLSGMNLSEVNLSKAILWEADLSEANLSESNLWRANLWRANLSRANLSGAILSEAILWEANLSEANLWKTNLLRASLSNVKNVPFIPYACPDTGSFIGYKKARNYIVELEILSDARRCSATGRKCRCDKAKVLSIQNIDGTMADVKSVSSRYNNKFVYRVGEIVEEPNFNDDRWNECSDGIHFFINRQEAVNYIE